MRKAMKKMAKEQEKRERKYTDKPQQKTSNEILGIKSISEMNKKDALHTYTGNLKVAWYFEKAYEKLILVGLCGLGLWKLLNLIGVIL